MIALIMLCIISAQARTYTIGSGKWTDPKVWGNQYPGATIKAGDVVIIKGQVTLTTPLVIEGLLQIETGASMVGMKDLTVAKTGRLVNRGNLVAGRIINEGNISNFLVMEAMNNIENHSVIENTHCMHAGKNFISTGGNAYGQNGRIYANRAASVSAGTELGVGMAVLSMKKE